MVVYGKEVERCRADRPPPFSSLPVGQSDATTSVAARRVRLDAFIAKVRALLENNAAFNPVN
jgi:hypothetical protein